MVAIVKSIRDLIPEGKTRLVTIVAEKKKGKLIVHEIHLEDNGMEDL